MTKENSNLQKKPKRSEMSDEERVRDFQRKLYLKAKQDKDCKFYVLYDKISLPHFLREAYKRVKANKGAHGIDGITFDDIEKEGAEKFLEGIQKELREKTYKPEAVKRVMIPKANNKLRPLGIPTIKDRVIQMSCTMVIEPAFEADFEECSYGFRPKRSAKDAVKKIKDYLKEGKTEIYDADLSSYFDTIPHDKLLKLIARRISDKNVIHLIKMWLKAPVDEDGKRGGGKKSTLGTPQGSVISPLLANIYLHVLDRIINSPKYPFKKHGVKMVRYADDFVLMAKTMHAEAIKGVQKILSLLKLSINEEKTRKLNAKDEPFDFLGFRFQQRDSIYGANRKYWNVTPSKKSMNKIRATIKEYLQSSGHKPAQTIARELNSKIRGWLNYFTIEKVSYPAMAKQKLRWYLMERLNKYYRRKSQRRCKLYGNRAYEALVNRFGLIDPCTY